MKTTLRLRSLFGSTSLVAIAALAGCSTMTSVTPTAVTSQALHMTGALHGGQQPISGAKIYLYTVGFRQASFSTSLLTTANTDGNGNSYVTTDASGGFTITGDYTCPSVATGAPSPATYLLALGGNPGLAAGTDNSAIALMATLGPCANLTSTQFITVNEVSTAAAVTALNQFMGDATHIGATTVSSQPSYGASQGIPNAMLTVNNLVDQKSGLALASPAGSAGTAPQSKLNTLGNILASCINTPAPTSTACAALFAATTPTGGPAPTDTIGAMLQIARAPGANVTTLYNLNTPTAPFQPTLTAAPNDFSLGITYTTGLSFPGPLAFDNSGDVFVANCPGCNGAVGADSIQGFTPAGTVLAGAGFTTNVHMPTAIAVDRYNSIWVTEAANATLGNQVTRLSNTGSVQTGFPVNLNGAPGGIALLENLPASAWITDTTNGRMSLINADGMLLGGLNTTGLAHPTAIAADGIENLYVIGTGSTSVLQYSPVYDRTQTGGNIKPGTTGNFTTLTGTTAGVSSPSSLAVDGGTHVWTVDTGTTKGVSELFGFDGTAISPATGYTTGINTASNITIDGAGTAWVANCRANCTGSGSTAADNIVHLSARGVSLTTSDGLQNAAFNHPTATAIDLSGNLWISNTGGSTLTELVGVAAPVITELETASSRHSLPATNYLLNPNFENGAAGTVIPNWTETTTASTATAKTDNGSPFSGQLKLTFYNGTPYTTTEKQTIAVPNGNYLLTCYIASGPGSTTRTTSLIASGFDTAGTMLTNSPADLTYTFQPYSLLVPVSNGSLTVGLFNNETYSGGGYVGWDSCSVTAK